MDLPYITLDAKLTIEKYSVSHTCNTYSTPRNVRGNKKKTETIVSIYMFGFHRILL